MSHDLEKGFLALGTLSLFPLNSVLAWITHLSPKGSPFDE